MYNQYLSTFFNLMIFVRHLISVSWYGKETKFIPGTRSATNELWSLLPAYICCLISTMTAWWVELFIHIERIWALHPIKGKDEINSLMGWLYNYNQSAVCTTIYRYDGRPPPFPVGFIPGFVPVASLWQLNQYINAGYAYRSELSEQNI